MDKLYVIKNKEGEYLSKYNNYNYSRDGGFYKRVCWTNNLLNAKIFKEKINIPCHQTVEVEITEVKDA